MTGAVDAAAAAPDSRSSSSGGALGALSGAPGQLRVRKVACIGAGYVGGPSMSMLALMCPEVEVVVLDINKGEGEGRGFGPARCAQTVCDAVMVAGQLTVAASSNTAACPID